MIRATTLPLVLALLLVLSGCGGGSSSPLKDPGGLGAVDFVPLPDAEPPAPPDDTPVIVRTGIIVGFQVGPDTFHVYVTDDEAIDRLVDIYEGREAFTALSGLIRPGPGTVEENLPWSWYIPGASLNVNVPGDPLTTIWTSLQYVETNLEKIVPQDLHYGITSANASLIELIDYR
jgi:hypothetical protein